LDKETVVFVVSDHGAKRMDGGICLNEWLWRQNYLVFKKNPKKNEIVSFDDVQVDWNKTKAWGSGGYYGRIFLNVRDREKNGIVLKSEYDALRDELTEKLKKITDPNGNPLETLVYKPEEIYKAVKGIPPDLIVYFGNLYWRAVGSLGYDSLYTFDNDTGPDACNHSEDGMFIIYDSQKKIQNGEIKNAHLTDIAPTILNTFGLSCPSDMQGRILNK
jgi:predicted AlkP superfamily phosphohydrolase/phosphomutase